MKKNYNSIFFIIWGLLFGGIPLTILILDKSASLFLLVIVVIGAIVFIIGIKNMIKMFKDKKILVSGKDGIGTFITAVGYGAINDVPMYKIVFEFTDELNEKHQIKTNELYTYDEVEIYKNVEHFKIKYNKNNAVIVTDSKIATKSRLKDVCIYCGTNYEGEKCPNCGATKEHK